MTPNKVLWILAGANGSGKSTFFNKYLKPLGLEFINADEIAKTLKDSNTKNKAEVARVKAWDILQERLSDGHTCCFETVFSHPSKLQLIVDAKNNGYTVNLIFIHIDNADENVLRVNARVLDGEHDVPEDKIRSRIPKALANAALAVGLADEMRLVHNMHGNNAFTTVAVCKSGRVIFKTKPCPRWAEEILTGTPQK